MIRVLVISPYPTVRAGLRALLATSGEIEVVWEAEGAMELAAPWPLRPDVALVDDIVGPAALAALAGVAPELGVIVLGGDPVSYRDTWGAAPRGFLTRDATANELTVAARAIAEGLTVIEPALVAGLLGGAVPARAVQGQIGDEALTPREIEVLQLLAGGLPNKTIAYQLGISEHTAKFHVSSVLSKLGAASRTEAVTLAARRGLLLL